MEIRFEQVGKQYHGQTVLERLDWQLRAGERWLIRGISGRGKTTLLRLLTGLELPSAGRITGTENVRFSMCFQENRLCGKMSSVTNLAMVCPHPEPGKIRSLLLELLPAEALDRPAGTLSGGMARRVALARARAGPSEAVILDEPFAGLDEGSRAEALAFVESHLAGRALVLVSHELPVLAGAKVLQL